MHSRLLSHASLLVVGLLLTACNQLEAVDDGGGGGGVPPDVEAAFKASCARAGCHASGGIQPTLEGGALDTLVGSKYVTIGDLAASEIAVRILPDATLAAIGATRAGNRMPQGGPYDTPDVQTIVAWIAGAEFPGGGGDESSTGDDPTTGGEGSSTGGEPLTPTFTNVVEIFKVDCSCHQSDPLDALNGGLDLRPDSAYANIVDVPSIDIPATKQVAPSDAENSYLYQKIVGAPGIVGMQMPLGSAPMAMEKIQLIEDWINAGALDD